MLCLRRVPRCPDIGAGRPAAPASALATPKYDRAATPWMTDQSVGDTGRYLVGLTGPLDEARRLWAPQERVVALPKPRPPISVVQLGRMPSMVYPYISREGEREQAPWK